MQHAVESALPGFGRSFVALAILPFAFTTILALYYMAETNVSYLCRDRPTAWLMGVFQLLFLAATGYSAVNSATVAWSLGDIGVGLMSWLNIIAILLLQGLPWPHCATTSSIARPARIRCSTRNCWACATPACGKADRIGVRSSPGRV